MEATTELALTLVAALAVAVVPILVLYMLLQKYIVGGLTAGATKG